MAKQNGQKFIKRNRPPRVHITYENPTNAEEKIEIPFVMGVMSDLSGNSPGVDKEEISQRKRGAPREQPLPPGNSTV